MFLQVLIAHLMFKEKQRHVLCAALSHTVFCLKPYGFMINCKRYKWRRLFALHLFWVGGGGGVLQLLLNAWGHSFSLYPSKWCYPEAGWPPGITMWFVRPLWLGKVVDHQRKLDISWEPWSWKVPAPLEAGSSITTSCKTLPSVKQYWTSGVF